MIERSFVVRTEPAAAFRVWTEHIGTWWPPGHRVSGDPSGRLTLEGEVGGRFYERTDAGREIEYGQVLAWEPPRLLRYFWFIGSDREHPTEVEVQFRPVDGGTRVEITHRRAQQPPERYENTAARFERGWAVVAEAFAAHIEA